MDKIAYGCASHPVCTAGAWGTVDDFAESEPAALDVHLAGTSMEGLAHAAAAGPATPCHLSSTSNDQSSSASDLPSIADMAGAAALEQAAAGVDPQLLAPPSGLRRSPPLEEPLRLIPLNSGGLPGVKGTATFLGDPREIVADSETSGGGTGRAASPDEGSDDLEHPVLDLPCDIAKVLGAYDLGLGHSGFAVQVITLCASNVPAVFAAVWVSVVSVAFVLTALYSLVAYFKCVSLQGNQSTVLVHLQATSNSDGDDEEWQTGASNNSDDNDSSEDFPFGTERRYCINCTAPMYMEACMVSCLY